MLSSTAREMLAACPRWIFPGRMQRELEAVAITRQDPAKSSSPAEGDFEWLAASHA